MKTIRMVVIAALAFFAVDAAAQMKMPQTAEDHLAMAKKYQEQAASYRKLAAEHREMAAEYKKSALPPNKSGQPNPWVKKMEEHCMKIVKDAETMAANADKMAEYHTFRAKELQGK